MIKLNETVRAKVKTGLYFLTFVFREVSDKVKTDKNFPSATHIQETKIRAYLIQCTDKAIEKLSCGQYGQGLCNGII